MKTNQRKKICAVSILATGFFMAGCVESVGTKLAPDIDLGTTIGSLADVFAVESVPVEGYGVVAELSGTGSAECPPQLRAYLKQYILAQLPDGKVDVDKFINSRNTAVVRVHGIMPAAATKNQYFDVRVDALPGTTSLEGGWLYGTDLKSEGSFGMATKVLARAKGPVFIDTIGTSKIDKRTGYILGGGRTRQDFKITLALHQPNYLVARQISDLLNTRFYNWTAKAISPSMIELAVPPEYGAQQQRFISIVKATYITETPEITEQRVNSYVAKLAASEDKDASEIGLEAIGRESVGKLAVLLNSSAEEVRLRAARCAFNLGSDKGLATLRAIAMDKESAYRIQALEAITAAANRNDAAFVSRRLLHDDDFNIRLAAYEQLRKLDDITIARSVIAGDFCLEQIARAKYKEIYVSRSGQPRIVLFGAPIYCRDNIFVESADGDVTINAPAGQRYVSVIRKVPGRPKVTELKSSFELSDIVRTLCEESVVEDGSLIRPGLNVSYANAIALLKQMSESGAVEAQFRAGPLPKID